MTLYEALSHELRLPGNRTARDVTADATGPGLTDFPSGDQVDGYTRMQQERTLTLALWISMVTSAGLGLVNLVFLDWVALFTLATVAGLCPLLLELASRGRRELAARLLIALVLAGATFSLATGDGLRDPAVVAYPIIVILGGMLNGKRSLPLLTGAAIGSLAIITGLSITAPVHPPFTETIEGFLVVSILTAAAAMVVWVSMDNTDRNIRRIYRSKAKVRRAYEDTLEAWARALEYRDRETEGHSRRVTELSVGLARVLGVDGEELTSIRWGSLLHDVGKLAIPDSVLLKPGPLSPEERALMELHPVYAREMLSRIPFLHSVMAIPYHHHERWDGTGYPEGLAGENIPLAARIFSVVDQWEALSSDRPYRKAWPRERIVAYLEENAGRIFDPRIVEIFLRSVAPKG